MDKPPPPGYPKVDDPEAAVGSTAANRNTEPSASGGPYPGGPGAYPTVPPAGVYGGSYPQGTTPPGQQPYPQQQGAPPPQQQQPPYQQPYQPPVMGVPVLGQGAAYFYTHPAWGPDDDTRDNRFACCAWMTFAFGFFFPIFWLLSVLLPCCLPGPHVQRAATASLIAAITYSILAIILAPSLTSRYP
ncbi:hypothetical protein PLESTB_000426300 [Pleodorina starrii]|uniref:Uncharacterized protein n=1 Tax=Pleodorina starrii TaxID=330485 RepID=A0A9W6BFU9_9CHLO|nr:hypothetical protein PLESTM_001697800 [Pleodorina starrii]GLC50736.1 hypothetical protein PLESTB_000426300 [Pleodorina starrii]